jgi:hypothetical protein
MSTFVETVSIWLNSGISGASSVIEFIHENNTIVADDWWSTLAISAVSMRALLFPLRWRGWRNGQLIKLTTQHCNTQVGPQLRRTCQREAFAPAMKAKWTEICDVIGARPWKSLIGIPFAVPTFLCVAGAIRHRFTAEHSEIGAGLSPFDYSLAGALPVALMNASYLELQRRKSKTSWPFLVGQGLNVGSMLILMQMPLAVDWFVAWSTAGAISEAIFLEKSGWARRRVELQFHGLLKKAL